MQAKMRSPPLCRTVSGGERGGVCSHCVPRLSRSSSLPTDAPCASDRSRLAGRSRGRAPSGSASGGGAVLRLTHCLNEADRPEFGEHGQEVSWSPRKCAARSRCEHNASGVQAR